MSLDTFSVSAASEPTGLRAGKIWSWPGWLPLLVLPVSVLAAMPLDWPRWAVMWSLALSIFAGCKWLTWWNRRVAHASLARHAGYLLAWPGLDADAFLTSTPLSEEQRPTRRQWLTAAAQVALGAALLAIAARSLPAGSTLLAGWLGMIGVVLMLHFGSFAGLSCLWRVQGVDAAPLMKAPLLSQSVSEFWGRRWNTAFRDLAHRFLFRSLSRRLGPRYGLLAGFLFSGLVHDLVISLPAGGGYGGPTLYFLIQAGAICFERSPLGHRLGLGKGWRGRLFAFLSLAPAAGLLFHRAFVERVVATFIADIATLMSL